jgi:GNAT superfamily N-acetyltransferase
MTGAPGRAPADRGTPPGFPGPLRRLLDAAAPGQGSAEPPGRGPSGLALQKRSDLAEHPRVARAARYRHDLRVLADDREQAVVLVGRGLAGRWELAFEVDPACRGRGLGHRLAVAARYLVPAGEPLFAQVAPGNAAALRAVLAAGFRPVGSEVLFLRPGARTGPRSR